MAEKSVIQAALSKLLTEIFDGPPGKEAATASSRPFPGKTTIASHVDHVCYRLS